MVSLPFNPVASDSYCMTAQLKLPSTWRLSYNQLEESPPPPQHPEGAGKRAVGTSAPPNSDCFNEFPLVSLSQDVVEKINAKPHQHAWFFKEKNVLKLCFAFLYFYCGETLKHVLRQNSLMWVTSSTVKSRFFQNATRIQAFSLFFYHVLFKITASSFWSPSFSSSSYCNFPLPSPSLPPPATSSQLHQHKKIHQTSRPIFL